MQLIYKHIRQPSFHQAVAIMPAQPIIIKAQIITVTMQIQIPRPEKKCEVQQAEYKSGIKPAEWIFLKWMKILIMIRILTKLCRKKFSKNHKLSPARQEPQAADQIKILQRRVPVV